MPTKISLKNIPSKLWTAEDSAKVGFNTLASIKMRTSQGISAEGQPFKKYSTKPIYIGFNSDTGKRLKPKGGRRTKSGLSMFYAGGLSGGYHAYKVRSRKRRPNAGHSAIVDLTLSGQLMNNFIMTSATANGFTLGLTDHVKHYGYFVNRERPFIGLTEEDVETLVKAVEIDIMEKIKG